MAVNRVGLTGGLGCGKTTVAGMFAARGWTIIDTDEVAREVTGPGTPALEDIVTVFGEEMLTPAGELDRAALAAVVFSDAAELEKLNGIVHPRIRVVWRARLRAAVDAGGRGLVVIPLLYETHAEDELERVVCVACSPAVQRERLLKRGMAADQIDRRIQSQMPLDEKCRRADVVIWNDGDLDGLAAQVETVAAAL